MNARTASGVVVLAAGAAQRYGAPKLELPVGGVALVRRAALAGLAVSDHVVIVTGAWHERLLPLVADLQVIVVRNEEWRHGKGSSIACGVRALQHGAPECTTAVIMLADQVMIGAAELQRLRDTQAESTHAIAAAQYRGTLGAPSCFARRYFAELSQLDGEQGARVLLQRHIEHVRAVPLPDAQLDIDTPADYATALIRLG